MTTDQNLERLADTYRGRGYDVVVRPRPDQLPPFAADFVVEIAARRGPADGVLVAVRKDRDEVAADGEMQRYAEVTGAHPGWRFDLAVIGSEPPPQRYEPVHELSDGEIVRAIEQSEELSRMGFERPAVVAAWAALEAAMRMRLRSFGQDADWGANLREMVRELYSAGVLSPDEFRRVVAATRLRNQLVHGFAPTPNGAGEITSVMIPLLCSIARRLVDESRLAEQPV
ncbi:MAG: hypothetical protein ACRC7O_14330 [Fimbriiglobus sp.]